MRDLLKNKGFQRNTFFVKNTAKKEKKVAILSMTNKPNERDPTMGLQKQRN
jgi:hypothetical protein